MALNWVFLNVAVTLEQATKAQRGSRSIALSFLNLSTRWRWVVNATPLTLYAWERPSTHCVEAGWVPGQVWTSAEISTPSGLNPRTFQALASRYTEWAIPAKVYVPYRHKNKAVILTHKYG
jgi:hypothetical protein